MSLLRFAVLLVEIFRTLCSDEPGSQRLFICRVEVFESDFVGREHHQGGGFAWAARVRKRVPSRHVSVFPGAGRRALVVMVAKPEKDARTRRRRRGVREEEVQKLHVQQVILANFLEYISIIGLDAESDVQQND